MKTERIAGRSGEGGIEGRGGSEGKGRRENGGRRGEEDMQVCKEESAVTWAVHWN